MYLESRLAYRKGRLAYPEGRFGVGEWWGSFALRMNVAKSRSTFG